MQLKPIVQGLLLAGLVSTSALAQDAQRIEITGSRIKRVASEGALPVQTIRAEELEKSGITNAEQLVSILSANGNGQDNLVSNQGGDFLNSLISSGRSGNNGASGVSLRGLGPQNTLVLLNGRRVAAHGLNGKSVDLNAIPIAAVDRIEILKDGASAIYGTDAIGGVMNFILKRNFTGLQASLTGDVTQGGGGDILKGSLIHGWGDLDKQGLNLLTTLSMDSNSRLKGSQRDFHNGYRPARGLAPDTTGTPYANISAAGGTAFPAAAILPGSGTAIARFNPLLLPGGGGCEQLANQYLYRSDITGFAGNRLSCAYDYGKDWSLMQPVDRINLVSRGTLKLGADHSAFVELTASQVKSAVEYTPNQITTVARGANYPAFQQTFVLNTDGTRARNPATGQYLMRPVLDVTGNPVRSPHYIDLTGVVPGYNRNAPIRNRWRCLACGERQQDTTAETTRLLLGAEGVFAGWDYKLGLSTAQSEGDTVYGPGNQIETRLRAAMDTGLVNPFLRPGQSQSAEAMALLDWASAAGRRLYGGKAKTEQLDASISGELFKLPAGAVGVAAGFDVRTERFDFRDNTGQSEPIVGAGSPALLPNAKRDIKAMFAELNVPIVKGLETQLAVRHDRYSDFGSTTNPKVAVSWKPTSNLLLRGSVNRGFHAPDFGPLFEGSTAGQFTSDVNDPTANCPAAGAGFCGIRPATVSGGNPNLKPEKSKQWSIGAVVEPTNWMSASVDFFNVQIGDRISNRTPQEVLADNLSQFIARDLPIDLGGDGNPATIDTVRGGWINVAGDQVSGFDLGLAMRFDTGLGKVGVNVDGTYLKSYKTRKSDAEPWNERVGEFGDFDYLWDLKLRWKHTASVSLDRGDWSTTLTQIYKSGYKTEVDGYGSGVILQDLGFASKVKAYTLYNLSASYKGIKNATLTLGVKNLFDRDPPFSNHNVDNVAGAGWDARVGDPRGRSIVATYSYKFF